MDSLYCCDRGLFGLAWNPCLLHFLVLLPSRRTKGGVWRVLSSEHASPEKRDGILREILERQEVGAYDLSEFG